MGGLERQSGGERLAAAQLVLANSGGLMACKRPTYGQLLPVRTGINYSFTLRADMDPCIRSNAAGRGRRLAPDRAGA